MPEIRKLLVLCTNHVSAETASMLNHAKDELEWPVLGGFYNEYGWFMYAADKNDGTIPEELFAVMSWAKARGIHHLLFDRDADEVAGLPVYEW